MTTEIKKICEASLAEAKDILERGGTVAFPTETVYGLGADARSEDNPLIVHVHREYPLTELVYDERPYAAILREKFLPGPLTLVYRKKEGAVSDLVSCGLDTLAVRVPSHEGAQAFLRYTGMPIAAPSANISKHISPVSAGHVYDDLKGRIPLILEGGRCSGGIESTVCDVTGEYPVILRAGLVSREMIRDAVGRCDVYVPKSGERVRSPGMKYKHYAPKCRTMLFDADKAGDAVDEFRRRSDAGERLFVLCADALKNLFPVIK